MNTMPSLDFVVPVSPEFVEAETTISVEDCSHDEAIATLDTLARRFLGMSGPDFLAKWKSGGFAGLDTPTLQRVASALPLDLA